jgi:flagellar basal body-associated protein FliL
MKRGSAAFHQPNRNCMAKTSFLIFSLLASATFSFGQNANQAAVDTLTKDVAIAVFANIHEPKAQEIYAQLLECGDGCEAQQVIRTVGSWDAVGVKMQELSELKNTALFIAMSPEEANTAIRKQFARFYTRYKNDNNYGKPLNPAVQVRILSKIDALLPPAVAPTPQPAATTPTVDADIAATTDETGVDQTALQMSQLERKLKDKEENQLWMMILSALVGLLVGGGAVYFFLFRRAQAEIKMLLGENARLSQSLDSARQNRPTNEVRNERRQPQSEFQQKAVAYDAIRTELGSDDPLKAIRYLKQRVISNPSEAISPMRSGEPIVESTSQPERPIAPPVSVQPQTASEPQQPVQAPARNEVFYFPPPDPSGQFDIGQKSSALSPESAYRFSISADNPSVASFRFEADPGRVARFLTYRNYMIEPACESENSYSSVYTRVAMRRDGQAVLDNGVWRVKTKALIRYE